MVVCVGWLGYLSISNHSTFTLPGWKIQSNTFTSQAKKIHDNEVSCIAMLPHEADSSAVSLKLVYLVYVKMGLLNFCSIPSSAIKALRVIN